MYTDLREQKISSKYIFQFQFAIYCHLHGICSGQITCEIKSSSPMSRQIREHSAPFLFSGLTVGVEARQQQQQQQFISCQKRRVVLLHVGSMASSSNSHNPLLWDQVSECRPCATETAGGPRGGGFNLLDINFSSRSSLSVSLFASSNHKSLLGAITALVLQWMGGRIDSRVEDETRTGEKSCCKKITVAYAH